MSPFLKILPALLISLPTHLRAQDGGQLFSMYCSACHGADGKGASGGAFPPLAGSAWVEGEPKRAISIVLHGLEGPVEVAGKRYNLMMPPQGAALADDAIAAILTYVRSSWGHKETAITPEMVAAARAEHAARKEPWTSESLLELYPMPVEESPLKNLISRVYKGEWQDVPDFTKLESENFEEEHDGFIRLGVAAEKEKFGIVWEGDFMAPAGGRHEFYLDADDGAHLVINGKTVAKVRGIGGMNGKRSFKGKAGLEKGVNSFRLEYFEFTGNKGISLGWKGPGMNDFKSLTPDVGKELDKRPVIMLAPADSRTVIYRNFIADTPARAIGVGFPNGTNITYSAENLAPELFWTGEFMDAGLHWTDRGQGNQQPAGENVTKLTGERFLPKEAELKGYSLDPMGNPTFRIAVAGGLLTDAWKPGEGRTLTRSLTLTGGSGNLVIPLGKTLATPAESITLTPGKPATVTYGIN